MLSAKTLSPEEGCHARARNDDAVNAQIQLDYNTYKRARGHFPTNRPALPIDPRSNGDGSMVTLRSRLQNSREW
jgi:hypothetical protein